MTNKTEAAYNVGYDLALNALEDLSVAKIPDDQMHSAFAGFLTAVLTALYDNAPNRQQAKAVINFALKSAEQDAGNG